MSEKIYINSLSESKSTDTFDLERFNRLKTGHQYYDTLDDGTIIRQTSSDTDFAEFETPPFPAILRIFRVFHLNGRLKSKGLYYPNNVELGIWRDYDEEGNLIKEENYDEGYEYSFEDVVRFLTLRGADLRDKHTSIRRYDGVWHIQYVKGEYPNKRVYGFTLDGKTGKKLEHFENEFMMEH